VASQITEAALFGLFRPYILAKFTLGALVKPLFRQFQGEVRWVPGPMGENFSGSCTVTSRNLLIHIGATTATKSGCFDPKGVHQGLLSGGWRCVEESLATANFREFLFHALR
jgi:hypothetical protein